MGRHLCCQFFFNKSTNNPSLPASNIFEKVQTKCPYHLLEVKTSIIFKQKKLEIKVQDSDFSWSRKKLDSWQFPNALYYSKFWSQERTSFKMFELNLLLNRFPASFSLPFASRTKIKKTVTRCFAIKPLLLFHSLPLLFHSLFPFS